LLSLLSVSVVVLTRMQFGLMPTLVLAIALAALCAWLLTRSLVGVLGTAVAMADKIADGELGHRIQVRRQDEFGRLLLALKSMDAKLNEIVTHVRVGASAVGAAARQLAQDSENLNGRTQHQASALEETAASMEQLTATVKRNADRALHARELGQAVTRQAEDSAVLVRQTIEAMNTIKESSSLIAEIVGVIDEIAFQTNLLALNASVEAARAGEHGSGFAVVAAEVRNLAQRSAAAAKQIKTLIDGSAEKVQAGVERVLASGDALFKITEDVKQVTHIVAEIATASDEQAKGIRQVGQAVMQIDQVTQHNAALVEGTSSASKVMEQQAADLVKQIGFFRKAQAQAQTSAAGLIEEILIHQRENARLALNAVIARDLDVVRGASANIRHNRDRIAELWQQYRPAAKHVQEAQLADSYWNLRIEFIGTIEEIMRLLEAHTYEQAQQLVMTRLSAVSKPMFDQGERLRTMLENGFATGRKSLEVAA
jgi:methyl-accepting chemotaxis protein-1 (serine sensor receptor)